MRNKSIAAIALLVPILLLASCGPATPAVGAGGGGGNITYAQSIPPVYSNYTPGLTVVGSGTVEAEPDIVYLTLGVDLKGESPATIVSDASSRMEAVLAALRASGIAEADIRTAGYNLWVEQIYNPQTGQPTGQIVYHVTHYVRAAVRDLKQVGTVLGAAVEAGATTVSEVTFTVEKADELTARARQLALADAQKRAQETAAALNITLGKVLSVSESGGWGPVVREAVGGGGYLAPTAVPMPAGSFSVSVSVVVIYELP